MDHTDEKANEREDEIRRRLPAALKRFFSVVPPQETPDIPKLAKQLSRMHPEAMIKRVRETYGDDERPEVTRQALAVMVSTLELVR